jgi:ATP-dependent Lon protease
MGGKRAPKESPRNQKQGSGENDDSNNPPASKRPKLVTDDDTQWIKDDTLGSSSSGSNNTSEPKIPITLNIHIHSNIQQNEEDEDEEDEDEEEDEEDEEEDEEDDEEANQFIEYLKSKYVARDEESKHKTRASSKRKETSQKIPIQLSKKELEYYKTQPKEKQTELFHLMKRMSSLSLEEGDVPPKFKVLQLPIPDYVKSNVIKKITAVEEMGSDSGESYKLRSWIDAFLRIPFGKIIPLPVCLEDGQDKCTQFMINARKIMDRSIYGMLPAKMQIMQILAQLIVNPNSVGNVIALQGSPGVGKTSLARNAIAEVMKRPFEFFSLGGASDIAGFVGHSYTYEGSMWGRIADSIMHSRSMNPVMYFDELDKVSNTPHGDEIINMLIHLTDRSQNSQFHDRYFSGVDFNLSQCLFVFSFNETEKIHPILRDRMTIINCGGYNEADKKAILKDYIWPQLLDRLKFKSSELILTDEAIKYMITGFSADEKGVRTLIRTVEAMMTRLNMLRVMKDPSMKEYPFYLDYKLPFTLSEESVKILLTDSGKKEFESWRMMYQ